MTRLERILAARGMSVPDLCRAADLYDSLAYPLLRGRRKAGPTVQARVSEALGLEAPELFDEGGWPLEATASAS